MPQVFQGYQMMIHDISKDRYLYEKHNGPDGGEVFNLPSFDLVHGDFNSNLVEYFSNYKIRATIVKITPLQTFSDYSDELKSVFQVCHPVVVDLSQYQNLSTNRVNGMFDCSWNQLLKLKDRFMELEPARMDDLFKFEQDRRKNYKR